MESLLEIVDFFVYYDKKSYISVYILEKDNKINELLNIDEKFLPKKPKYEFPTMPKKGKMMSDADIKEFAEFIKDVEKKIVEKRNK